MEKMKKICLCAAAGAGVAGIAGISAKAVEGMRKKWFLRGSGKDRDSAEV